MKKNKESVQEFLARGGKIQFVPNSQTDKVQTVHSTTSGPVQIISLEEAAVFYSEPDKKLKSKKKKSTSRLDISALPLHLRKKFIDNIIDDEG